jgi:integrase
MENIDMELKEAVSYAEKIVRNIGVKDVEDKTKDEYLKIFKRIITDPDKILYEGSKGYYYKKKAALRFSIVHYIQAYIKKINSKSLDQSNANKIGGKLKYLIDLYEKHAMNTGVSPVTTKSPGKSKRKSLRKMPKYWREMVWDRCENYDYKGALAILQLTGARPSEIERGVSVTGDASSDFLEITIRGSKQGKTKRNGQSTRTIKIEMRTRVSHGSAKNYLLSQVAYEGHLFVQVNAKRLNDYVRRLSQKIWPRKKNHISPYSYRHQLSADLKGEGCPPPKISMTLGHRSVLSKKKYGTSAQARGSTHIGEVRCSHALREPQKSHPWEQIQASGTG